MGGGGEAVYGEVGRGGGAGGNKKTLYLPLNFVLNLNFSKKYCCYCCLVAKLCPILCDPIDCGLPGSSVHGILQARTLEWVTISFSRGSSRFISRLGRQFPYP